MSINSVLLETIENELIQNTQPSYQKIIPIKNYSYETKKTLDYIVEKYGGFINRYDDKIIIFVHGEKPKDTEDNKKINSDNRYASLRFEKINSSINNIDKRLSLIEEKVSRLIDNQNKQFKDQNSNLQSYLNYFKTNDNKKEAHRLINEILNHH